MFVVACGDSSTADDKGPDGSVDTTGADTPGPIEGAPEFEYVEVDGARCGNGTPVGIGVSQVPAASTLVVLVNGGGACWDSATCFGLNSAVHISTTYSAAVMNADLRPLLNSALFRRGSESPIANASLAFIPYCTGDLHSGSAVRNVATDLLGNARDVHHVGRTNMQAFASDLRTRFPSVTQVILIGFSAGGYGAVFNADLFDEAFGVGTWVLSDGSPFIQPTTYGAWRTQWDMALPEDCTDCASSFQAIMEARTEGRRHGLITTTNDEVIRVFFGYGLMDISPRTLTLVEQSYGNGERHAWVETGTNHVLLGTYATRTHPSGVSLRQWTDGFLSGSELMTVTP